MRTDKQRAPTQAGQPAVRVRVGTVESLLNAADWSVAELARRAHMDHSAVSRLLRGDLQPGNRSIAGLLHAFSERFPKVGFNDLFELFLDTGDAAPLAPVDDGEVDTASAAALRSATA